MGSLYLGDLLLGGISSDSIKGHIYIDNVYIEGTENGKAPNFTISNNITVSEKCINGPGYYVLFAIGEYKPILNPSMKIVSKCLIYFDGSSVWGELEFKYSSVIFTYYYYNGTQLSGSMYDIIN